MKQPRTSSRITFGQPVAGKELSPSQRGTITGMRDCGRTYADIARRLGIPASTVRNTVIANAKGLDTLDDQPLAKPMGAGDESSLHETSGNSQKPSKAPKRSRRKQDCVEGQKSQDEGDEQPPSKKRKASRSKDDSTNNNSSPDLSDIILEGEERDAVPVYETCDMIRRKIDQCLKQPGLTQTAFCRDMKAAFHGSTTARRVTQAQLSSFRGKNGYDAGNTSTAFYAAYCYFEKLRIKEGKPKSKDRLKMEELWSREGGFDTKKLPHNKGLFMGRGEGFKRDKYGQFTIMNARGSKQTGVM